MTPAALISQLRQRKEECAALRELWHSLMPDVCPHDRQFFLWLGLHNFERMVFCVKRTASKHARLNGTMSLEYAVRFCSKIANRKRAESDVLAVTNAALQRKG